MEELIKYCDRSAELQREPKDMDELAASFDVVKYFDANLPWVYADLYRKGVELYGEEFNQHLPDVGRTKKTRQNWIYVGDRILPDERVFDLEFSFYSEVAKLVREARESLLASAQAEEWSIAELRRHVKGNKPKKKKMVECPLCHGIFDNAEAKVADDTKSPSSDHSL